MRCLLIGFASMSFAVPSAAQDFDREVGPVLVTRCLECHSGTGPKGGLDLSTRAATLQGGKSGPAVVPGKPGDSELWLRVEAGQMPPKRPLLAREKEVLRRWIAGNAPWGAAPLDPFSITSDRRAGYDWWSLQPIRRPEVPRVRRADWARTPIDCFVLRKLEDKGLSPAEEADRRTLIRRVTFGLIGMPPTPERVEQFVHDRASDAYEKLVDELLASPHYGERWARHWLDIARFGESNGFEHDELRKNAWPYRDWLIESFNRDLPYDAFVRQQIAGDVLHPGDPHVLRATGFLVAGGYDSVGQKQQSLAMRAVVRQDELEDMISTLGQTFLGLTVHCARCHDHKFDPIRQVEYYRLSAALAGVRHGERDVPGTKAKLYAVTPQAPEAAHVLLRGEPARKGEPVTAGGVRAVHAVDFGLDAAASDADRRRKLAEWLTSPGNPLPARVLVNRLWHHHFGIGIVETPSDFGFSGGRPSHPELLDWLADDFARGGWSSKRMHRLIVTSAAYRQQSRWRAEPAGIDADNRLLWRKSPLRLEAEAVRDAMLTMAGKLNTALYGPGYQDFKLTIRGSTHYYLPRDADAEDTLRRSIYRTWVRSGRNAFLDALDCPDPSTLAPRRNLTTTPLQALTLLNGNLVLHMADYFAERLEREAPGDASRQIQRAYALAFGRPPSSEELADAGRAVSEHGLGVLCRAIFNCSEFLYVD